MKLLLKLLAVLAVVLVIAWLGLWWYAEGRMQAGALAWLNRLQANGELHVSYDSMQRGSSPLAATLTLSNVQMTVQAQGAPGPVTFALPSYRLRIDAANPTVMHVDYPSQMNINTPHGDAAITFGASTDEVHLNPAALFDKTKAPFQSADATASNVNVLASSGSLLVLHIDSIAGHANFNEAASNGETAFAVSDTINGLALSPLMTKLANVPFGGKITELGITFSISGPIPPGWLATYQQIVSMTPGPDKTKLSLQTLHDWAAKGGNGNFILTLVLGPSTLNADGNVTFDANAQPSGAVDLTADHLDAFSDALTSAYPQTQDDVNQAQARLSPYLTTTDAGGQTLTIHAKFGNNAVTVNGQQVAPMPPLDWNALENPPPPAADDGTGDGTGGGTGGAKP